MFKVIWSRSASSDLERHYKFLKTRNPDTAVRAIRTIVATGDSLTTNPYRGTVIKTEPFLRKLKVFFGKYGYVIHYTVIKEEVIVLHIYHGRENRPY